MARCRHRRGLRSDCKRDATRVATFLIHGHVPRYEELCDEHADELRAKSDAHPGWIERLEIRELS